MNLKLLEQNYGYRIVSLALDDDTKKDLIEDNIDFLFVADDSIILFPDRICVSFEKDAMDILKSCSNFDVFELLPDGQLRRVYDDSSIDNSFFVTSKCNSNCVMCPSPDASRMKEDYPNCEKLIEIAQHIPAKTKHLTITGGEPFMAGKQIFEFLDFLRNKFEETEFLVLTNGRVFAVQEYVDLFYGTIPRRTIVAIPLHGASALTHDSITRADGSFIQTMTGLKHLLKLGIKVELRLVVTKLNVDSFMALAELIASELSDVEYVSIVAAEMTGNARKNLEQVWVPYKAAFDQISPAVMFLIRHEITVRLYNFPLCTVGRSFYTLCEKSISTDKVRYSDCCNCCKYRDACGGVFAGTLALERAELNAL